MKNTDRRREIIGMLIGEKRAIAGEELAEHFGVSRQIIVKDINTLRDEGYGIVSTHYGYLFKTSPLKSRDFKVKHTTEETERELSLIISEGATVENVYVWHKVYGKIEAPLNIYSTAQINEFIEGVRSGKSTELMNITGGYHYHTVRADSEEILDAVENTLRLAGYLADGE